LRKREGLSKIDVLRGDESKEERTPNVVCHREKKLRMTIAKKTSNSA